MAVLLVYVRASIRCFSLYPFHLSVFLAPLCRRVVSLLLMHARALFAEPFSCLFVLFLFCASLSLSPSVYVWTDILLVGGCEPHDIFIHTSSPHRMRSLSISFFLSLLLFNLCYV